MKRSRVQSLTALASVTLLMILLGSPAQAAPWQLATDGWLGTARWVEVVRSWLTGERAAESTKPSTTKKKTVEAGTGPAKGGGQVQGDTGVCTDPDGNRIPCPGT